MIVRPQQHWLRRIFVWHGSVLSKISSRLLLNFVFSIAVIFMLPWYTHLGIKFTLAPALVIVLGADVGTALMARILTFDLSWLSPLLIFIGVIFSSDANSHAPGNWAASVLVLG